MTARYSTWFAWTVAVSSLALLWPALPSQSAELTDVVDAFDDANDDPFDFHAEPSFRQRIERGSIIREVPCTNDPDGPPDAVVNATRCPDEPDTVFNKELDYERVISALDVDLQFGIWHDLEFHVTFPIIFSDRRTLDFATDDQGRSVTRENSGVDPADSLIEADVLDDGLFDTYRYIQVEDGPPVPTRSGLGDMTFGLAWAPFNSERRPHLATLKLGFDYTAPTAEPAARDNESVGRGLHQLQFSLAGSRRFSIVEPYFGLRYILPIPTSDSLFQDYRGGQRTVSPGQRGELTAGTEFILFENAGRGQIFTFDLGFDLGFQAEGRDYSPLFEALSRNQCAGVTPQEVQFNLDATPYEPSTGLDPDLAACGWIVQQPSSRVRGSSGDPETEQYVHDGITTVEGYATLAAHIGANFQISEYVEVRVHAQFETETEHFLTAARTGKDQDGDDEVDFNDPNERSPVYNPTLDSVGHRLRAESIFNVLWNATLAFQF